MTTLPEVKTEGSIATNNLYDTLLAVQAIELGAPLIIPSATTPDYDPFAALGVQPATLGVAIPYQTFCGQEIEDFTLFID